MLRPRIIPCLLIHNGGLVKTTRFTDPKYVGDPLNAVRIFNEKEVDELVVLDLDATPHNREPDYALIRSLAAECRMPLCYGGGVRTVEQIDRIVSLGVEKVAMSAAVAVDPALVARAAAAVGGQSIVAVLDVKRTPKGTYDCVTHRGTRSTGRDPVRFARELEQQGCGEIVLNAVDRDGVMQGYDLELVASVRDAVNVPITVLGGAGSLQHLTGLFERFGILGAAAGSLFVFKGIYRAVLINYPNRVERERVLAGAQNSA